MSISYEIICKANAIVSLRAADAIGHTATAFYGAARVDEKTVLHHLRQARENLQDALRAIDAALVDERATDLKTAA